MYDKLNTIVLRLESRLGRTGTVVLVGFILMIAAGIYARPAVATEHLGEWYSRMAQNPFEGYNYSVGFRILMPLLSWLIGLRGDLIIVTNLLFALGLLILVFTYFRRNSTQPGDALFASGCIALSLVTLSSVYFGGYTDSLTYFVIFLMWWQRRRPWLLYSLYFLGMLNREALPFILPWLLFVTYHDTQNTRTWAWQHFAGLLLSNLAYWGFRYWWGSLGSIDLTLGYYLGPLAEDPLHWFKRSFSAQWLGLFTVFKALWLIPVAAGISLWQKGRQREVYAMLILLVGVAAQLLIAFDTSRMLTMGFMILVVALVQLFESNAFEFRRWAGVLFVFNLFIPQLYTAAKSVGPMYSLPTNIILILFFDKPAW